MLVPYNWWAISQSVPVYFLTALTAKERNNIKNKETILKNNNYYSNNTRLVSTDINSKSGPITPVIIACILTEQFTTNSISHPDITDEQTTPVACPYLSTWHTQILSRTKVCRLTNALTQTTLYSQLFFLSFTGDWVMVFAVVYSFCPLPLKSTTKIVVEPQRK